MRRKRSRGEVREAVKKLKEGKTVGGDGISGEMWKFGGERLEGYLWDLCNRVWKGEEWIEEWNEGIIVSIRKQGDEKKVEEYRKVTLMPTIYKVYAMILGERLEREVEEGRVGFHKTRRGLGKGWGLLTTSMC